MSDPTTVSELYPSRWLSTDDLQNRSYTLTIDRVDFEAIYSPITKSHELKAYLVFTNAKKNMILNVTQCHQLTAVFQSERFADWKGEIMISPARAPNGKRTIAISRPAVNLLTTETETTEDHKPDSLTDMNAANEALID
jgi:hypothetical protein